MGKQISSFLYFKIYKKLPLFGFTLLQFTLFIVMLVMAFLKKTILPVVALSMLLFTIVFANELREDFKIWLCACIIGLILAIFIAAFCDYVFSGSKDGIESIEFHKEAYRSSLNSELNFPLHPKIKPLLMLGGFCLIVLLLLVPMYYLPKDGRHNDKFDDISIFTPGHKTVVIRQTEIKQCIESKQHDFAKLLGINVAPIPNDLKNKFDMAIQEICTSSPENQQSYFDFVVAYKEWLLHRDKQIITNGE